MIKRIRNGILYAAVLAACSFLLFLLHGYFFLTALLFFGILFLYDMATLKIVKNNVKILLHDPKRLITKGELVYIPASVKNPTYFFSPNLYFTLELRNEFYGENSEYTWNVPLYAKEQKKLQLPMKFQYSGKMIIAVKEIRVRGILGILETKQKSQEESMFYVFPKSLENTITVREYDGLRQKDEANRQEAAKRGSHCSEVSGIREYILGDSMRDIHWKLSAKKEKMMVKEHVTMTDTNQSLLVELADVFWEQKRCIEDVLELLMNFLQEYLMQEIPFELVWWNQKKEQTEHFVVNRIEQIFTCMEQLMDAGIYQENFLLEQRWLFLHPREEKYLWIGMDEETAEGQIVAEGNCKTIVRTGK